MKKQWLEDLIGSIALSAIAFVWSWGLGVIPYAGPFVVLVTQFFLGWLCGWVQLPKWCMIIVLLVNTAAIFFGFLDGTYGRSEGHMSDLTAPFIVVNLALWFFGVWRANTRASRKPSGLFDI